eukprot:3569977-Prymnesium_polylepis.1
MDRVACSTSANDAIPIADPPLRTVSFSPSVRRASDKQTPLKCLFFTWNVGNKMPIPEELEFWCPEDGG